MTYRIVITPFAQADFLNVIYWYNQKRDSLGYEFIAEADRLMNLLSRNPFIFRIRKKQLRLALLKRFPFTIVYEIEKQNVIIFSVIHQHSHPKKVFRKPAKK